VPLTKTILLRAYYSEWCLEILNSHCWVCSRVLLIEIFRKEFVMSSHTFIILKYCSSSYITPPSPPHIPMTSLSLILRPSPTFLCSTNSHALRSHIPIQSPYLLIIFKLVTNPKLSKLPSFPYFSSSFLKLILPFTPFPFHT